LIGGVALFAGVKWGRLFVLVLGALQLMQIPFGTIIGIYTFWVLTQDSRPNLPSDSQNQTTF